MATLPKLDPKNLKDTTEVLRALEAKQVTLAEAGKRIRELEDEAKGNVSPKVSAKGAVSVYGLQRMPVTLYASQWERLLSDKQRSVVLEYIKTNEGKEIEIDEKDENYKPTGRKVKVTIKRD